MLFNICQLLRCAIPQFTNDLSEQEIISGAIGEKGVIRFTTKYMPKDDENITISGVNLDTSICNSNFNTCHRGVKSNIDFITIEYPFKFLTFDYTRLDNALLHHDIRVQIMGTIEEAMQHFRAKPQNHIFIIPKFTKDTTTNIHSLERDINQIHRYFNVLLVLHDKSDRHQLQNIEKMYNYEDNIISAITGTRINNNPIAFNSSEFIIGTDNTTMLLFEFVTYAEINKKIDSKCFDFNLCLEDLGTECKAVFKTI